jgi:hypothetical protein
MASTYGLMHVGRRIVCAVAQKPWTGQNGNTFCTLAPLLLDDGSRVQKNDFPDNELVWWMLAAEDKAKAEPGQLISVKIEESREAGKPGKDFYQVTRHSVAEVTDYGFTELIELPDSAAREPASLLSQRFSLNHCPTRCVYVIWQQHLYGQLLTKVVEDGHQGPVWVRFELSSQNASASVIQRLPVAKSEVLRRAPVFRLEAKVSRDERAVYKEDSPFFICRYLLVPTLDLNRDMAVAENVPLETDTHILTRITNRLRLLNRDKRRQMKTLLDELDKELESKDDVEANGAQTIIVRVQAAIRSDEELAQQLTDAIVDAGLLKSQVDAAIQRQVEQRADEIQQLAKQKTEEACGALNHLQEEQKALTESIQRQKQYAVLELQAERKRIEEETASIGEELARARKELKEREESLEKHLEPVAKRLESSGIDVVNQFLALSPLLRTVSHPIVDGNHNIDRNTSNLATHSPRISLACSGVSISDWTRFIDERLWPVLADWTPHVSRAQAELLHTCVLGCRCSLLPNPSWGTAYAKAVGAKFALVHVEPDWINFSRAWDGYVDQVWRTACDDSNLLHFLMFAGVDRSPTSAWALPMLGIAGGFCDSLPVGSGLRWPDNLRVLFTFDPGPASFVPSHDFVYAAGAPSPTPRGTDAAVPGTLVNGHVPASVWLTWARPQAASAADVIDVGELEASDDGIAWHCARRADTQQLARILLSAGKEGDSPLRIAKKIRLDWPREYVKGNNERD